MEVSDLLEVVISKNNPFTFRTLNGIEIIRVQSNFENLEGCVLELVNVKSETDSPTIVFGRDT